MMEERLKLRNLIIQRNLSIFDVQKEKQSIRLTNPRTYFGERRNECRCVEPEFAQTREMAQGSNKLG
jgi:hypothetical protein